MLREFLESEGLALKKRFGQNFMVSPGARRGVVEVLGIGPDDEVWEIGPGLGAITTLIVDAAARVVVYEIDHGIMSVLGRRFGDRVTIVAGDRLVRRFTHPDLLVIAPAVRSAPPDAQHKELEAYGEDPYHCWSTPSNASIWIERIRDLKGEASKAVQVTISIGVASPDKNLTTPEKVMKAADKTLYRAKKCGRNRVEIY